MSDLINVFGFSRNGNHKNGRKIDDHNDETRISEYKNDRERYDIKIEKLERKVRRLETEIREIEANINSGKYKILFGTDEIYQKELEKIEILLGNKRRDIANYRNKIEAILKERAKNCE